MNMKFHSTFPTCYSNRKSTRCLLYYINQVFMYSYLDDGILQDQGCCYVIHTWTSMYFVGNAFNQKCTAT